MSSHDNDETYIVLKGGILGVLIMILALPVVITAVLIAEIVDKVDRGGSI